MAEQMFQIGVKGLAQNKKGEILLLHVPKWGHNPVHWDLPGGRMDPGETFLDTLARELKEEIGVTYIGSPHQLMAVLTDITIPVGQKLIPLILVVYRVELDPGSIINLDKDMHEDKYQWFSPKDAAKLMSIKFSVEFCDLVKSM